MTSSRETTDRARRGLHVPVVILIAAAMVLVLGWQLYVVQQQQEKQDERESAARVAEAAFVTCLNEFAVDLVETADTRTAASAKLDRAERRLAEATDAKSDALDRIIETILLARRTPPEATERQFDAALADRYRTQQRYDRLKAEADQVRVRVGQVREENPYAKPEAQCTR